MRWRRGNWMKKGQNEVLSSLLVSWTYLERNVFPSIETIPKTSLSDGNNLFTLSHCLSQAEELTAPKDGSNGLRLEFWPSPWGETRLDWKTKSGHCAPHLGRLLPSHWTRPQLDKGWKDAQAQHGENLKLFFLIILSDARLGLHMYSACVTSTPIDGAPLHTPTLSCLGVMGTVTRWAGHITNHLEHVVYNLFFRSATICITLVYDIYSHKIQGHIREHAWQENSNKSSLD